MKKYRIVFLDGNNEVYNLGEQITYQDACMAARAKYRELGYVRGDRAYTLQDIND